MSRGDFLKEKLDEHLLESVDDDLSIHVWIDQRSGGTYCGAVQNTHPGCRDLARFPKSYGWPTWEDLSDGCCPMCYRPICAFCAFLFLEHYPQFKANS